MRAARDAITSWKETTWDADRRLTEAKREKEKGDFDWATDANTMGVEAGRLKEQIEGKQKHINQGIQLAEEKMEAQIADIEARVMAQKKMGLPHDGMTELEYNAQQAMIRVKAERDNRVNEIRNSDVAVSLGLDIEKFNSTYANQEEDDPSTNETEISKPAAPHTRTEGSKKGTYDKSSTQVTLPDSEARPFPWILRKHTRARPLHRRRRQQIW